MSNGSLNIKISEDTIKKQMRKKLEILESAGDVVWFERLNSGRIITKWGSHIRLCRDGTPDFVCVIVNKNKTLSVLFIECKKSSGFIWSDEQQAFKDRYTKVEDVHYILCSDVPLFIKYFWAVCYDRVNDIKLEI